jgi:hypothetical protein
MFRLDEILPQVPTLLKIDVEGFETEVIKGAERLLSSPDLKAIIIELNGSGYRYGYDEALVHQHLLDCGFQPYLYTPQVRNLQEISHFGTHNTIYCRDLDWVQKRISNAAKVKVLAGEI